MNLKIVSQPSRLRDEATNSPTAKVWQGGVELQSSVIVLIL